MPHLRGSNSVARQTDEKSTGQFLIEIFGRNTADLLNFGSIGWQTKSAKRRDGRPVRITTPAGIVRCSWLENPDTRFNPDGVYKVDLLIPKDSCIDLCKQLDELAAEVFSKAKAAAKNPRHAKHISLSRPYSSALDKAGEDAGQIEFRFKMIAKVKMPAGENAPRLIVFDANGRDMKNCPAVCGGSKLKINFTPVPYYNPATKQAGVSLRLNAVQILELVTRNSENAAEFGFTSGEGSFVADEHDAGALESGEGYQYFPTHRRGGTIYVSPVALAAWVERRANKKCLTCVAIPI